MGSASLFSDNTYCCTTAVSLNSLLLPILTQELESEMIYQFTKSLPLCNSRECSKKVQIKALIVMKVSPTCGLICLYIP